MTLEELWELFPIFLIEPNEKWVGWDCGKSTSITKMLIRMRKQALFASGQRKPANFMVIDIDNCKNFSYFCKCLWGAS